MVQRDCKEEKAESKWRWQWCERERIRSTRRTLKSPILLGWSVEVKTAWKVRLEQRAEEAGAGLND